MGLWHENTYDLISDIDGAEFFGVRGSHYPGKAQRNVAYTVLVINSWPEADERLTFVVIKHDVIDSGDSPEATWCRRC